MNKKKYTQQAFMKALSDFHYHFKRMKKFKSDKRITKQEKEILQCWLWLKENKHDLIIETLTPIIPENELIRCQLHLILGMAFNNKTDFKAAIENFNASIKGLIEFNLDHNLFTAYYSLFMCYLNSKDLVGMTDTLSKLSKFELINSDRKILKLICEFNLYSFENKSLEAKSILDELQLFERKMTESMSITFLMSCFYFHIKNVELDLCEKVLDKLKFRKSFLTGSNFKYMSYLLNNLLYNKPIYAYEKDFKQAPYLHLQIKTLHYLEANQASEAKIYWGNLNKLYPEVYQDNFQYLGEVSLFSLCLDKLKNESLNLNLDIQGLTKDMAVLYIVSHQKNGIGKEELYEAVWGKPFEEKLDMNKLQKCISRLRALGHEINYKKDSYFIEKKNTNIAA